ncbi:hypothetical protein [Sneathiella sp.]|jgi:hypothetical protein|uniref:hypothetical protein n=1 Tax=Sneathiella sp. TaxID=1964365 RepID=UPI0039E24C9B
MSDLIAGFAASSSYSSFAEASRYSSPYSGLSQTSTSIAQEASFSFDAFVAEDARAPVVSLPFGEGDKSSDDMMEMLAKKLEGFLEPFGKKGEELAEILGKAMESLSDLVSDTAVDAAALSVDIRFARVEETYSQGGYGASSAGIFSGFALEVSVATTTVDFDPDRSAVINMEGSKVEFSSMQMIEGHKRGVFRREADAVRELPGFDHKKAEEAKQILDFLKDNQKRVEAFSRQEEHSYRHQLKSVFNGFNRFNSIF